VYIHLAYTTPILRFLGCVWFSFLNLLSAEAEPKPNRFSFSAADLEKLLFCSTNLKAGCTLFLQLFLICENYTPIGHIYTLSILFYI
jgi:hypothetical protein